MAIYPRIQGTLVHIKYFERPTIVGESILVGNHLVLPLVSAIEQQIRVPINIEVPEMNILLRYRAVLRSSNDGRSLPVVVEAGFASLAEIIGRCQIALIDHEVRTVSQNNLMLAVVI